MDQDEVLEGYLDGLKDERDELPASSNRSDSYRHGWSNGRDDRLARPRGSAAEIRRSLEEIKDREASYL